MDSPQETEHGIPVPAQFETLGEWFRYCRSEGFSVPTQVPHAISKVMKHLELGRQEAFEWLITHRLLHIGQGIVVANMRALMEEVIMDLAKTDEGKR